nr:MAG TPA: hypothetical protein [Caudoviricetes sp.]
MHIYVSHRFYCSLFLPKPSGSSSRSGVRVRVSSSAPVRK